MKKVYIVLLMTLIALSAILIYKSLTSPIKVALIGNFEEERYNFETNSIIAGRIAEKDINDSKGIKGRNTELIIRNDKLLNPDKTIQFLKKNNIQVMITTNSSEELKNIEPYLEKNKIVCLSVGSTTSTLSRKNDYIYRLMPDDEKELKVMGNYLLSQSSTKNIVLVYNNKNIEYKNSVEEAIKKLGGNIILENTWEGDSLNYTPSNLNLMTDSQILIVAPARDTAIIAQKLRKITNNLYGLSWCGDNNLLVYGGRAVEGIKFTSPVDFTSTEGYYGILSNRLKEYSKSNGLIPNGVYEAYMIIRNAYEVKLEKHTTLKQALDNKAAHKGLDKYASLDEYGDSTADENIFTVENGKFVKIGGSGYEKGKN